MSCSFVFVLVIQASDFGHPWFLLLEDKLDELRLLFINCTVKKKKEKVSEVSEWGKNAAWICKGVKKKNLACNSCYSLLYFFRVQRRYLKVLCSFLSVQKKFLSLSCFVISDIQFSFSLLLAYIMPGKVLGIFPPQQTICAVIHRGKKSFSFKTEYFHKILPYPFMARIGLLFESY